MGGHCIIMYTVLLVDPNAHSREKIKRMIEWDRAGFALKEHAGTAGDAMHVITKHAVSLVLINIRREYVRGMQLCAQIRQTSRMPIILIGGNKSFHQARKALHYKVSDYLPDPVSADDLLKSLRTAQCDLEPDNGRTGKIPQALTFPGIDQDLHAADIIDQVKAYVKDSLDQPVTLKAIARSLHFNCAYLGQKFKEYEKMTFHEYLLRQRMEKAKSLLRHTQMKVYEIAGEVGYSDLDWFYKKFKAYTGVSANEYRKMVSVTA